MSPVNFINESWHKQFEDKDFLDKKKLVGRVYHLMVQGMLAPTPDARHGFAVDIVTECANSMFPACTNCGKRLHQPICKECKIKGQGILGIIH